MNRGGRIVTVSATFGFNERPDKKNKHKKQKDIFVRTLCGFIHTEYLLIFEETIFIQVWCLA